MGDVDSSKLSAQMAQALPIIKRIFSQKAPGTAFELTAGREWYDHGTWSLHHTGNAIDIRTRTLSDRGIGMFSLDLAMELQKHLDMRFGPKKYKVIHNDAGPQKPHIHIQFNGGTRLSTPGDYDTRKSRNLA